MEKHGLDLGDLKVQSFATTQETDAGAGGTVYGYESHTDPLCCDTETAPNCPGCPTYEGCGNTVDDPTCPSTCDSTCPSTCEGNTCDVVTCDTCSEPGSTLEPCCCN